VVAVAVEQKPVVEALVDEELICLEFKLLEEHH